MIGSINSLLDACQFVLEIVGESQTCYWLASQVVEIKLWRASEGDVRDALNPPMTSRPLRSPSSFCSLEPLTPATSNVAPPPRPPPIPWR